MTLENFWTGTESCSQQLRNIDQDQDFYWENFDQKTHLKVSIKIKKPFGGNLGNDHLIEFHLTFSVDWNFVII